MECDYKEFWDKDRYLGAWHSVNDIQAQAGEKRWKEILEMIEAKISHMQSIEIPYKKEHGQLEKHKIFPFFHQLVKDEKRK